MGNTEDVQVRVDHSGVNRGNWPSLPRGHKVKALLQRKMLLIDSPHVKELNEWVRLVNQARGGEALGDSLVPWFDPSDGGATARILILLEAPGRGASAVKGSGFISIDNDDATAANMFNLVTQAGLQRESFAIANIVPWYLPDGTRTRATRRQDVLDASMYVDAMLGSFDELHLVMTMGEHAAKGWEALRSTSERARSIDWIKLPHPSATNLNVHPEKREVIQEAFTMAATADEARKTDEVVPQTPMRSSMVKGMVNIEFKPVDILLLSNCINEARAQVSDWESHARLGGEASRVRFLHRELRRILADIPPELVVD